jgi:Flp pilus assembly protein TadG
MQRYIRSTICKSRCWSGLRACCRRLRNDSGNSIVELALVLSLFGVPMLVGTAETAIVVYDSIEVSNAANAAASYGMLSSTNASDMPQIRAVAQAEASDLGNNLTATPTAYYACSSALDGTQYSSQSDAVNACTGAGNHPLEFIKVTTSASITPPIGFPGLPKSLTLSGSSVMEVEE